MAGWYTRFALNMSISKDIGIIEIEFNPIAWMSKNIVRFNVTEVRIHRLLHHLSPAAAFGQTYG